MKNFLVSGILAVVLHVYVFNPSNFYQQTEPPAGSNEVAWSSYLSEKMGGEAEYRLPDGSRVDIYHRKENVAYEVEWCKKWPESIGQSLFYALSLDATPGVILLKTPDDDEDYLQCLATVDYLRGRGIPFKLIVQQVK
jgi:hypothetical protein